MEKLEKARKDDLAALGEHAKWADSVFPKDQGKHLNWLATNVRKNPNSLTPEIKQKIEHYTSMYHLPQIKNLSLHGKTLEEGLQAFHEAEQKGLAKQASNEKLVSRKGWPVTPLRDGKQFWDLGVAGCKERAKTGGHCGNMPSMNPKLNKTHERFHVLESIHPTKLDKNIDHGVYAVENKGYITEIKGRFNNKPKEEYHAHIIDLFEAPHIKGFVGGGFLPGSNFHPDDVQNPELKQRLKELEIKKPNFFSPDINDLHESIKKDPFLDLRVRKDELPEALDLGNFISLEEQHKLANHPNPKVREKLAKHPNLHPEVFNILVNDSISSVRIAIAARHGLHPDLIKKFANDYDDEVRIAIAERHDLHPDLINELANDSEESIRKIIAKRHDLHPDLINKLANDQNGSVRAAIAARHGLHPDLIKKFANDYDDEVRIAIAKRHDLHPDVIKKLANDYNEDVREAIAEHPNLHPNLIKKLANDLYGSVRAAIARRSDLPPNIINKLANDLEYTVREQAFANPNMPLSIMNEVETKLIKKIRAANHINEQNMNNERNKAILIEAKRAAHSLRELRKHRLIKQLKTSNSLDFLNQYKFSHNEHVRNAAQERINELKNLKKSISLPKLLKSIMNQLTALNKNSARRQSQ